MTLETHTSNTTTDISLIHYIRKLIKLPNLIHDMWTDDQLNILEEYLSSNHQRLLIIYIDQHTSSLQLLYSIPSIPFNISHGLYYFIRKTHSSDQISSVDEFLKHIQFGYIHGKPITCLTSIVSTLFGPLFMNKTTVQDMIKNDFTSELNRFLGTFYDMQYKDQASLTYLYIPKDGVDRTIEELVKDKALVTRYEAVMLKWHHQLKEILLIQDQLMSIEDKSTGIDEEIDFWEKCLENLHNIAKQLQRIELENIIQVLTISKSAYIQQFLQVKKEIQEFTEYIEDCLKFLKILFEPSLRLNHTSIEELKTVITDIFYRILIISHHSKFFSTSDRIKLLISKINNQIINRCSRSIDIKRLFQGYVLSTQGILQECFQIIEIYMETCLYILKMHEKYSNKPFQCDNFFQSIELFREHLNEIDQICECMKIFGWYRDGTKETLPIFSGIQGDEYQHILEKSQQAFDRALSLLKIRSKYVFDISANAQSTWSKELKRFFESIHEIEIIIVKLINESMTKAVTIEQMIDIVEIFSNFQSRSTIQHILIDKIREIYRLFLSEIEDIRTEIVSYETKNLFDLFLPTYSSKAMWVRHLIEYISKIYQLLNQSLTLISQTEIKNAYEKFLLLATNTQKRLYQQWLDKINDYQPKKSFQKPFLKENNSKKYFINVYFDPEIIIALNECLWWLRLNYEIPYLLTDVYHMRRRFQQIREETNEFIRKFNKIIQCLNDQELDLFEEKIRAIWKKLQPAFNGKINFIDENSFQEFALQANNIIDQLNDMVTLFKENYITCSMKCVQISQQLFIKIDSNMIFNYTEFVELIRSVNQGSRNAIHEMYEDISAGIHMQQVIFKNDPDKIHQCWDYWLSSIDCMFEKALLVNITKSLEQLSYIINGDAQITPTPFLGIELCLNTIEAINGNMKYMMDFRPSLEQLSETLNSISKFQLIESIKRLTRLCDLFSFDSFQREPYYTIMDNHPIKDKLQNKISLGITNCIKDIEKYIENTWFRFRQLWEVDKESFIAVYESENTDLQGLEADISRYTEVANNINNQETIINIQMIQIDCTSFKVSLVQICHEWQQSLIYIVLNRLEKDLQMVLMFIKINTEKINILPKTYDEVPIYQQFIDELKADIPRIEGKLPLINEEVALLLRYEIEIDSKLLENYHSLSRVWENYKLLIDESITSFKHIKEAFKIQLQKEQEKYLNEINELQKYFQLNGPHQADIPVLIALNECEKIEEQIEIIENEEKRLKNAYRIFNIDLNTSKELQIIKKDIEILKSIWLSVKEYEDILIKWKTTEFRQLKINELNDLAQNQYKKLAKMARDYKAKNWNILDSFRDRIDTFRRIIPLIESLHNPHMRSRHWEQIKTETEKQFQHESNEFTLEQILNLHFEENIEIITEISENATKEYSIERTLENIVNTWNYLRFEITLHKPNVFKIKSIEKVIQLYETHHSRHSVMLVGKTLSGKSTTWKLLKYALNTLNKRGFNQFNKVLEYPINPKSVSLGELYGHFNLATNEWNDGILSTIMRQVCSDEKPDKKFILFDAPIDTSWIESMNSLMDDNKLLTLANGERISMPSQVTLLFETEDLSTASPATVSRAGIVYCDYEKLGWRPYLESWLKQKTSQDLRDELLNCTKKYLEPIQNYKKLHCKELIPIHELNGIISLTKLFDTFWYLNENHVELNDGELISIRLIEMIFVFCLIWSVAASVDDEGRKKIDIIFRETEGTFPNKDTVFEFYIDVNSQTWLHWEDQLRDGWVYDPEIPFYKMIVPTVDTIRYEYLIRNLLINKHQVLLVGSVGTGKTTVVENVLSKLDSVIYNILTVHMSAQTTSKILQDIFETNLEKRAKNLFVPINGKKLIAFIDDMNMPAKDTYGFQPSLELIRTWIDYEFWYDRKTQTTKFIKDMYLITAMGPPGGGRQKISRRLQSRFNLINMTFPFDHEICRIFGTMLNQKLNQFDDDIKHLDQIITKATVDLYKTIEKKYLPTPTKIHYTFNMRDISRMFEGLLLCNKTIITNKIEFLRLWIHEAHRVYSDRFLSNHDQELFIKILTDKLAFYFDQVYHNVCLNREPPIYSDVLRTDGIYEEIRDYDKLKHFLEQALQRYNKTPLMLSMDLVMFRDAVLNICRIVRVLRRPRGNLLLLGIGGSGRQSLVRLAAFLCDIVIFQIEIGRRYGQAEFKEDLRRLMKLCGISNREVVFLFLDTQIIDSIFLEDINALLHTGEVPNLFRNEDIQEIRNQLSSTLNREGIPDINLSIMQFFYHRIKSNLHMAICMSPFGETFRNYIRMYPALVNCTTVIYFSEWSHEALIDVAYHFLMKFNFGLDNNETIHRTLANLCAFIHVSSKNLAIKMKDEFRREIYITPTNYLQFVRNYHPLFETERSKIQSEYNRLQMGIIKVAETREKVGEISIELEKKKILLVQLQHECEEFLEKIVQQKNTASERERQVQAFGIRIGEEEIRCQNIATAAHEELNEVEPLLIKANEALEQLTKRDIGEVKAYVHPPYQVEKVMKALMILKGKEDTWDEAKKDLANVDFIKTLTKFPKDDITDRTLRRMQPFINDSELIPEKLKGVSSAASALCVWIRAVESYARVYRIVQPKKDRYKKALNELNEKQHLLEESKTELKNLQKQIELLRLDYESKIKEKDNLQKNANETEMFLDRATKLLDGISEKRILWDQTSNELNDNLNHLLGNSLLACAFLSYMGPFLSDYREEIVHQIWEKELIRNKIQFTTDFHFSNFMTTPTVIREWNIQGLPRDNFSTENAILSTRSLSYPLFIDPQSQATKWIKRMEKSSGLKVIDFQMRDYMKILEECIKMGRPCLCQNIHEDIPQILNPILLKSIKKTSDLILQIGDREIIYNPSFRLYFSTRLANPKYKPEIYSKLNLINFAIKEQGLEEQLLGIVVRKEKPELENAKDECIITISTKQKEKESLEEEFLRLLSETKGSLLENLQVFQSLDLSKQSQKDINDTLKINQDLEIKIDFVRNNYRLVAQRAAILFFVLQDLTLIDSMYQFSLEAYIKLFVLSIEKSPKSLKLNERIEKLNDYHTYAVYKYGCRGLFERHKLLFSFHICTKIMNSENRLNPEEYQFFIRANTLTIDRDTQFPNPFPTWLNDNRWDQMSELIRLPDYRFLRDSFDQYPNDWKEWYISEEAEKNSLPGTIDSLITEFGRMLIIRCLRPDRITYCVLNFVTHNIGSKYVEPPILQLNTILEDSNKRSPLIFILSPGVDPSSKLQQLAEENMMAQSRYFTLSLGQGQASAARKLLETGMKKGHWIYLANCHLSISWLPELEKIIEQLQTAAVHNDFRLWLSSAPIQDFPISILQISLKITNEPQKGIKANMKRLYELITPEQFQRVNQNEKYRKLLFALAFFHSVIIERKKFLQLGWNVHYTFNDSDFQISENLLAIYLDLYDKTPFHALKYLIAIVIYGGHCTDEWDMRLLNTYIDSYIRDEVLDIMYYKLSSLPYYYMPRDGTLKLYKDFINSLPTTDHPEAFGQHPNADVASQIQESKILFDTLLAVLPQKTSATAEKEVENEVSKAANEMLKLMPQQIDIESIRKYMLIDTSPLSVVLLQEAERYNALLLNITTALNDLLKSIEGFVVMSIELDELFKCIYEGRLPHAWQRTYHSLKPLPSWFQDLRQRINFFNSWVANQRQPLVYWISAFSYPTAFLTAVLQRTARKEQIAVDQLSWEFEVNKIDDKYLHETLDGVYVTGLYLEGAGWDRKQGILCEAQSMELITLMPTIHFKPVEYKKKSTKGVYIAPCYYSSVRVGSFIVAIELKTGSMPSEHWIKRATALLMNLDN